MAHFSTQLKAPDSPQAKKFNEEIRSFLNSRAISEQVIVGSDLTKEVTPKLKNKFSCELHGVCARHFEFAID